MDRSMRNFPLDIEFAFAVGRPVVCRFSFDNPATTQPLCDPLFYTAGLPQFAVALFRAVRIGHVSRRSSSALTRNVYKLFRL